MSSLSPAFVYTEVQLAIPFIEAPWKRLNPTLLRQPGFRNKTWLAGVGNQSVGGFYEFDTLDYARRFVVDYFPAEGRSQRPAGNSVPRTMAPTSPSVRARSSTPKCR